MPDVLDVVCGQLVRLEAGGTASAASAYGSRAAGAWPEGTTLEEDGRSSVPAAAMEEIQPPPPTHCVVCFCLAMR